MDRSEAAVNGVLEEHVARARPPPYAKRWWTDKLTTLRHSLSAARNHLTAFRRRGEDVAEAAESVELVRRLYMSRVEQCEREHRVKFSDNRDNIWKAYAYTKASRAGYGIPVLNFEVAEVTEEREKADLLLSSFFPVPPKPVDRDGSSTKPKLVTRSGSRPREYAGKKVPLRIELPKLTLTEVEAAIMQSKPDKPPGLDETTFRAWKELWPVLGSVVLKSYQASLDLRHVPRRWRTAKIVVLRKPNKSDYSNPKAYQPTSFLETISKGLEAMVARRLSYLAETHRLLPENHFGGQPDRSADQALNLPVDKKRGGPTVLSLVSFDVQGAFNGVHPSVLADRLESGGYRATWWPGSKASAMDGKLQ